MFLGNLFAYLAHSEASLSATRGCGFVFYQPRLPEAVRKLRKF